MDDVKYIEKRNSSKLFRSELPTGALPFTYVGAAGQAAFIDMDDSYFLEAAAMIWEAKMAKNKSVDPGLQYLIDIGFDRIRGKNGLTDRWIKVFGKKEAEQIRNKWESLPAGSKEFYDFKNSDPEISRSFSEAYDSDIIRKACNYIASHKAHFGKTILEVGCESGYMTGFLAKEFPEARILSIDRSQAAVDMAKSKMEAMSILNVEFRVASLQDIEEQFDTVFCMRTIQENLSHEDAPYKGEPLLSQFFRYSEMTEEYTQLLISCLKDDGTLCVFERVGHNPLMCGWMMELCFSQCAPDISTYNEVQCEEAGNLSTFQAFVCRNKAAGDPQKMFDLWYSAIKIDVNAKASLTGWNALAYLRANAGDLIRGVRIFDRDNKQVGRFAAFRDKDDDALMYYLNAAGDEIKLYGFSINEKNNVLDHLQKMIDQYVKAGLYEKEIDPEEDFLEGK